MFSISDVDDFSRPAWLRSEIACLSCALCTHCGPLAVTLVIDFVSFKVVPGANQQLSQKRAAEGDAGLYGQQGPPSYYDNSKRLRY